MITIQRRRKLQHGELKCKRNKFQSKRLKKQTEPDSENEKCVRGREKYVQHL